MMLRGNATHLPVIERLSARYPNASAVAAHYAHLFRLLACPAPRFPRRQDFVLSRIRPASVAWFCFFSGAICAAMQLLVIFGLAAAQVAASASREEGAVRAVKLVTGQVIGDGNLRDMFSWIVALLTDQNQIIAPRDLHLVDAEWLPSVLCASILLTPLSVGIICFLLGGLAAFCVNFALRVAGGIRFQNHLD